MSSSHVHSVLDSANEVKAAVVGVGGPKHKEGEKQGTASPPSVSEEGAVLVPYRALNMKECGYRSSISCQQRPVHYWAICVVRLRTASSMLGSLTVMGAWSQRLLQ